MNSDPIVVEIDKVRESLLAECGNDLSALLRRMATGHGHLAHRVSSREELDRRFPATEIDTQVISQLGIPWHDPIVDEVRAVRAAIAEECGYDIRRIADHARDSAAKISGFRYITLQEMNDLRSKKSLLASIVKSLDEQV